MQEQPAEDFLPLKEVVARADSRPSRPGWRSLYEAASLEASQERGTQLGSVYKEHSPVSTYDPGQRRYGREMAVRFCTCFHL